MTACQQYYAWTRYFLEAQGYRDTKNIVFQDNKSAIFMEKNGKASSSKRTKHINIWYYIVTDGINKKDLTVKWCPIGNIIDNLMTKRDQGTLFTKFRKQIMGVVTPAKSPGPGKVKDDKTLVKQGKLDHRSVLDGDCKRTKNGHRTNGIRAKKNLCSKKNINTVYVRHKGVKQRIST
jgi:hypothetical protein